MRLPCGSGPLASLKISLGSGLDAIGTDTGLGDVEIDFHNPFLAPDRLDQESEIGFQTFSEITATLPQEGVFCDLLRNGRSAPNAPSLCVAFDRFLNRFRIETIMCKICCLLPRSRPGSYWGRYLQRMVQSLVMLFSSMIIVAVIGGGTMPYKSHPGDRYEDEIKRKFEEEFDEPHGDSVLLIRYSHIVIPAQAGIQLKEDSHEGTKTSGSDFGDFVGDFVSFAGG